MPTPSSTPIQRSWYLDNLKILLTVLVVAHHAAQAYGPTGGSWPVGQAERCLGLAPFITINSMFFMGLFFFISGYFTPASLERKGAKAFVSDRLVRLGLPALAWLPIHRLTDGSWGWEFAHLWFVVDLLALSLLCAAWHSWRPSTSSAPSDSSGKALPNDAMILGFVLLLGGVTGLLRIEYPVDRWIRFLGIFPMEPAHWPQYLSLFLLGIWAWRTRWLERLPDAQGQRWLLAALCASAFITFYRMTPAMMKLHWFSTGKLEWQNWSYATLEAFVCVALCIGLLWFFRRVLNRGNALLRSLAANCYGIYWIHIIPVVGVQLGLREAPLGPLAKFFIAMIAGFLLSWIISHFILRRGWLGRKVF